MKTLAAAALAFDFYGPLLTERQQELIRSYYLEDLSLGEIAELTGISRQAVHDQIRRSEASMTEFERRLGLVAEHRRREAIVAELVAELTTAAAAADTATLSSIRRAQALAARL